MLVAQAAADRGAEVTLVSGPLALNWPANVKRQVEPRSRMDACSGSLLNDMEAGAIKAVAAGRDYRPHDVAEQKIKRKLTTLNCQWIKSSLIF